MKKTKGQKSKKEKKDTLESLHSRIFETGNKRSSGQYETLEQPHAFKYIDSVTTYGAYQEPI